MRVYTRQLVIAALLGGLFGSIIPIPANAATCAAVTVVARGEPSSFQWLARTKARANWRAKVRRLKDLGSAYADWNQAQNPAYNCGPDGKGTACSAAAIPCRP